MQEDLYELRQQLATARQPRHTDIFERFHGLLATLSLRHPFELGADEFALFERIEGFIGPSLGHVTAPTARYLYRLSGIGGIVHGTEWDMRIPKTTPRRIIHRELRRDASREGPWLQLARYAKGNLVGVRGVTWWSTIDLFTEDFRRGASRLGIPNDRIAPYPVILRIAVADVSDIRVPTVLDAFDGPVFDPTPDAPIPQRGNTISLENTTWLTRGADEYVLGPLAVTHVHMLPLIEPGTASCGLARGEALWRLLASYHSRDLRGATGDSLP